jgi:hypothetical protein
MYAEATLGAGASADGQVRECLVGDGKRRAIVEQRSAVDGCALLESCSCARCCVCVRPVHSDSALGCGDGVRCVVWGERQCRKQRTRRIGCSASSIRASTHGIEAAEQRRGRGSSRELGAGRWCGGEDGLGWDGREHCAALRITTVFDGQKQQGALDIPTRATL